MGLLGVPKLQNMYTLVQRERGNVYVNVARTPGTFVGTFMGSCLGTWEHVCELVWERTSMCENSIGNVGTCEFLWEQEHMFGTLHWLVYTAYIQ
jgi:hypothetical protein